LDSNPHRIAIIGAGFSGTVLACNLLRRPWSRPVRITLIDRDPPGHGLAYAEREHPFVLNVPAGRMSATSTEPLDFVRFAQARDPKVGVDDFLPRALYGEYLEWKLRCAELAALPPVVLERLQASVQDLRRPDSNSAFRLALANGSRLEADEVVLALGNPSPTVLPGTEQLESTGRYVNNPWETPDLFRRQESVLVVGTGLTMVDVVTGGLRRPGGWARAHAISRHGLAPIAQAAARDFHPVRTEPVDLGPYSVTARTLFHQVRKLAIAADQRGGDWRDVITHVRTQAPKLWPLLPVPERQRFLRHVRAYWDVHRHRLPPQNAADISYLSDSGRLRLHAGRILRYELLDEGVRVTWRPRGGQITQTLNVDRVVNCTGPDYRCTSSADPLVRGLVERAIVQADPLNVGIRTDAVGGVLNARESAISGLYYLGPLLRARHWETTAVPELREHAERLARHLWGSITVNPPAREPERTLGVSERRAEALRPEA
jgi:uncharacterized NAD(P)/FAD-binding protein YdhS